jgi:tetraacyldisaccharide 4'-kinase
LVYGEIVPYFTHQITIKAQAVLGVCGIARPVLFQNHLQEKYSQVQFKSFPDHHLFTEKDIDWIVYEYEQIKIENKIIITTEKDYQKLLQSAFIEKISPLPLYYLPIEIAFSQEDENAFQHTIQHYVQGNPRKY